jgi:hypothetical protein
MIITRLMGGLGNQMFQYAAGRALALRLGVPLKLDLSWFGKMQVVPREYLLRVFPTAATEAAPEEIEYLSYRRQNFFAKLLCRRKRRNRHYYVAEPSLCSYWPCFTSLAAPVYLDGYWQQEEYFTAIADIIRRDFSFPALDCPEAAKLALQIASDPNAVCVHIRRGDYVTNPTTNQVIGLCPPEYYAQAIGVLASQIGKALSLFLFTDDPGWVRYNFDAPGYPVTIVDFPEHHDKPYHDMHLMSLCRHHIIANSSFSWWGAWLRKENDGLTIAPERWFAAAERHDYTPVPARWIKI